jgi:formate hydrogenlyase subunit 6/NADH:ubiquinone oxidoreductase subunit I
MLRGIHQFNNPNTVASSNFLPQYDIDNCVFCKKCTELCPMYTINLVDEQNENKRIEINLDRCIGCGVCAFNCKSEAITMVKKFDNIPVETMRDLVMKRITERNN